LQDVAPLLTEQIMFDAARSFILKTREGTDVRVYGPAGSGETQAALPSQK
jgi:hypothetical protein